MADRTRSLIGFFVVASLAVAGVAVRAAGPELYFSNGSHGPIGATPMVFGPRDAIELRLELRAPSVKERDTLPTLAVAGKTPNVRIEMTEFRKGTPYLPASFVVDHAGDLRVEGPYQTLSIWPLVGRSQPFYFIADHFGLIGKASDKHWEGTYRITASYQNLQSPPIFVTIR